MLLRSLESSKTRLRACLSNVSPPPTGRRACQRPAHFRPRPLVTGHRLPLPARPASRPDRPAATLVGRRRQVGWRPLYPTGRLRLHPSPMLHPFHEPNGSSLSRPAIPKILIPKILVHLAADGRILARLNDMGGTNANLTTGQVSLQRHFARTVTLETVRPPRQRFCLPRPLARWHLGRGPHLRRNPPTHRPLGWPDARAGSNTSSQPVTPHRGQTPPASTTSSNMIPTHCGSDYNRAKAQGPTNSARSLPPWNTWHQKL